MASLLFSMATVSGTRETQNKGVAMGLDTIFAWLQSHLDVLIALISAVVAVIGAFVSRNETRKQRALQLENIRHLSLIHI